MDGTDVDEVIKCMVGVIMETYGVYFKLKWNSLEFFTAGRNGLGTSTRDEPEVYTRRNGHLYGSPWLQTIRYLNKSWTHWTPGPTVELDGLTGNILEN